MVTVSFKLKALELDSSRLAWSREGRLHAKRQTGPNHNEYLHAYTPAYMLQQPSSATDNRSLQIRTRPQPGTRVPNIEDFDTATEAAISIRM